LQYLHSRVSGLYPRLSSAAGAGQGKRLRQACDGRHTLLAAASAGDGRPWGHLSTLFRKVSIFWLDCAGAIKADGERLMNIPRGLNRAGRMLGCLLLVLLLPATLPAAGVNEEPEVLQPGRHPMIPHDH